MQPLLAGHGIELINQGGARTVIGLCTEHVAKFEPTLSGMYGNRVELSIWKAAPPQLREYLAPIFSSGQDAATNWIVMGRATDINPNIDDDLESFTASISGIGDLEYCNLGVYDGHLVVVDYGERTGDDLDFIFTDPEAVEYDEYLEGPRDLVSTDSEFGVLVPDLS